MQNQSTQSNPLLFFDYYFKEGIYKDIDLFRDKALSLISKLKDDMLYYDLESCVLLYKEFTGESFDAIQYTLNEFISPKIKAEVLKSIMLIEENTLLKQSQSEVNFFIIQINNKIDHLTKNELCIKFPFLIKYLSDLKENISFINKSTNNGIFPLQLNGANLEEKTQKAKKLFQLLTSTENPIIECQEEEFINAFTGKPIINGIKWLLLGKNKLINKKSIFYFIQELDSKKHLANFFLEDISNYIKYIFRDSEGNELQNLKQTKYQLIDAPLQSNSIIDSIISSL